MARGYLQSFIWAHLGGGFILNGPTYSLTRACLAYSPAELSIVPALTTKQVEWVQKV